jgi:hypothetical protein
MISFSCFLDSGAHSLFTKYAMHKKSDTFSYYDSKEFYIYVDEYAQFIIKNKEAFPVYVNVDVIFNPEKTMEVQKYLEEKWNLRPLPVFHFGEDYKYIEQYMEKGYEYIGIGGLGQKVHKSQYYDWADELFKKHICDKKGYPKVKTHGFAMTNFELLFRYPWYSVDSSSYIKNAVFGILFVPQYDWKKEDFDWLVKPMRVRITNRPMSITEGYSYYVMPTKIKEKVDQYIKQYGFEMGESIYENGEEKIIKNGLVNNQYYRAHFNAFYFLTLAKKVPAYPRQFKLDRESNEDSLLELEL